MDAEKYNRSVRLLCPTCGGDQFEFESENQAIESVKCNDCGRVFAKDQLIEENRENIQEHVKEMGQEASKDIAKELRDLQKGIRRQ